MAKTVAETIGVIPGFVKVLVVIAPFVGYLMAYTSGKAKTDTDQTRRVQTVEMRLDQQDRKLERVEAKIDEIQKSLGRIEGYLERGK